MKGVKKKVLAISGSTRERSSNRNLIQAIEALAEDRFTIHLYTGLADLPHFNPDLDGDIPLPRVQDFRDQVRSADGVLICTPEYAMGVPGSLKNAIDWTVSSMEFSGRPVALITASSSGQKGHRSLIDTLQVIEARMVPDTQLLISFVKTRVNSEGRITDDTTKEAVIRLIDAFAALMDQ